MHYVFPYECPYPQLSAEAQNFAVVSDYVKLTNSPSVHTDEELKQYIEENSGGEHDLPVDPLEDWEMMSQWTMEEELHVGHNHQIRTLGSAESVFSMVARVLLVVGGFLALWRSPLLTKGFSLGDGGLKQKAKCEASGYSV